MVKQAGALPILSRPDARVGLFGGTFDPVHLGHLAIARAAIEQLKLDQLFFVPAAQAPLRDNAPTASAQDRMDLLKRAIEESGDPRMGILDVEIKSGGINYTVDTVRRLRAVAPGAQFFWLFGADQFTQLDRWREPEELARMVEFAVFDRPGSPPPAPPPNLAGKIRWKHLVGEPHPASSSEIRRRLQKGEPVDLWLPRTVLAFIEEKQLYR